MELMRAPFRASGKVKIAVENILRIDRIVSHLLKPVAARQKGFAVEAAGWSQKPNPVATPQSGRPNSFGQLGELWVSQEILPGKPVVPGHGERLCHPSNAPPARRRAHALLLAT